MRANRTMLALWGLAVAATVLAQTGREQLIPQGGAPPDLFLVYTGDVIGYLDPCG